MLFIRRKSAAKKKHLRGLLRAGGYCLAVTAVVSAVQVRAARAEVKNRTVELGRQMLQLANATQHDVNKLSLNGQPMWIGSSMASDSPKAVLDRYEAHCKDNAAQTGESWKELATKSEAKTGEKSALGTGVMRSGDDREGTVVCFTKTASSKPTVGDAVKSFSETGELGAFGSLRYVYAKTSERGNTVVLTAWTDDRFNIQQLIPEEGKDAGGSDFQNLPRPPRTQRLLSGVVDGTPFGVNVYKGGESPAQMVGYFDTEMKSRGWFTLDPEIDKKEQPEKTGAIARLYEKDGVVLTIASNRQEGEVVTALGLAGATANDGTKTPDGRKAIDMSPSEKNGSSSK